ncbi:MAG: hypothetical protein KIS61_03210 [Candidatus Eremiobacteraeota bacterium]|nr:hypothetical protein [Candidatus Eremiobacteraeota bacterium]
MASSVATPAPAYVPEVTPGTEVSVAAPAPEETRPSNPPAPPLLAPTLLGQEQFLAGQFLIPTDVSSKPGDITYAPLAFDLSKPLSGVLAIPEIDYIEQLQPLNTRYPGLTERLKEAEARAWIVSVTSAGAGKGRHTDEVLKNPPWPTSSFGSSRQNIREKALQLQEANPKLSSSRVEDYDFEQAKDRAEDLFAEMEQMFPESEFAGAKFATRAKTPQSLEKKLAKRNQEGGPEFSLAHLTDSVGARLDCTSLKMMGEAAHKLEKHYEGKIVAKDDYVSQPGALGYRALHYIVDLGDRMAEIQLSTHDLRATDLATHDTLYKPEFPIDAETAEKLSGSADRVMEAESFRYRTGFR